MERFENKINSKIEIRDNGDLFIFQGNQEELLEKAEKIIKFLDPSFFHEKEKIREWLIDNKEEIRPQGVYAIFFDKGSLFIQNRNARGHQQIRETLKKAVENI